MKTKLSKKLLSAFLAIIMVVTSIPLMGFTAFAADVSAADDANVLNAKAAMQAFQDAIDNPGEILTNVLPAYKAYVNVQAAIDAYKYGTLSAGALKTYYDELNTLTAQVKIFEPFTANQTGSYNTDKNYLDEYYYHQTYNSLLYAEKNTSERKAYVDNLNVNNSSGNNIGVLTEIYYPQVTMLYTGDPNNVPKTTVAMYVAGTKGNNKDRYAYSNILESNVPGLDLAGNWKEDSNRDVQWALCAPGSDIFGKDMNNLTLTKQLSKSATFSWNREEYSYNASNSIEYRGDGTDASGKVQPVLQTTTYNFTTWSAGESAPRYDNNTNVNDCAWAPITIINYKYLIDTLAANGEKMKTVELEKYSEGGLMEYFTAMETATQWNPNDYFNGGSKSDGNVNNYTKCAEDMVMIAQDMNRAYTDLQNSERFEALRSAIDARRSDYNNGIKSEKFEQESYNGFVELYKKAEAIMSSLPTTGYDESKFIDEKGQQIDIVELAEQLKNYVIVTNVYLTDVTELTRVIDEFESYVNIFTAETYSEVAALVAEAKATVWPTPDGLGDYKSLLVQLEVDDPDDPDDPNQLIVNDYTARIIAAIPNLRIDPDAVIMTSEGRYSLNSACDLVNHLPGGHPAENFTNYGALAALVTKATEDGGYRSQLPTTPLMDYNTQYQAYWSTVDEIARAYADLKLSFILMDDGQIARDPQQIKDSMTIAGTRSNQNGRRSAQLGLSISDNQAVLFKTTHEAATLPYGEAYITFGTQADNGYNNNYLDSFTMNATADSNGEIGSTYSEKGKDLTADQKNGDYKGLLSYNGITLTKFEVSDKNYLNTLDFYGKAVDGTVLRERSYLPANDYYTEILATTEGLGQDGPGGAVYARSTNSSLYGTITLRGIANVEVGASPAKVSDLNATLSREEILAAYPSDGNIVDTQVFYASANYGGTFKWHYDVNGASQRYASYAFVNSKNNGDPQQQTYETGATVVDVANYFDFIRFCDRFTALGSEIWDADSWSAFQTALSNAKDYVYEDKTAEQIKLALNPKYSALYTALEGLIPRTYKVNFITKDAKGNDVDNIITVNYGETLNTYIDQINAIDTKTTYTADFCTWTCNDTWALDPAWNFPVEIDINAVVNSDAVYYAVYTATPNLANFDQFNAAKRSVLSLADLTYTVAALEDLASKIDAMTYFTYSPEEQAVTSEQYQSEIDAETRALNVYLSQLKPVSLSGEAYDAATTAAQMRINAAGDIDQYDLVPDFTYFKEVNVGGAIIKAVTFTSENELNEAVANFLNDLNSHIRTYDIYLNDEKITSEPIPFGKTVVVDSDKTVSIVNPDEITNNKEDIDQVNWSYSYDAPSRNGATRPQPKYMTTATSFGFIVKGDAYLTTTPATQDETNFLVTVKASTGNIIDVCSTTGEYTMPSELPSFAYYTVDASNPFSNGAKLGDTITVTEDTTIIVNYIASEAEYQIDVFTTLDDWMNMENMTSEYANYNQKVELSADDAYCWVAAIYDEDTWTSYYTVIYYGDSYSFYAYREYLNDENGEAIVALSKADYDDLVSGQTELVNQYLPDVVFDEDASNVIVDGEGNPILGVSVEGRGGSYSVSSEAPAPAPTVAILTDPVVVTKDGSTATKFSLVSSFSLPEGYSVIESGYLFTKNTDLDSGSMILENSGVDKDIVRMKSSKYTVGNQFVVNYNTTKTFDFKYKAYSIIKNDETGEINTYYSKVSGDFNNAAL